MKKIFMVRSPTDSDFHTFDRSRNIFVTGGRVGELSDLEKRASSVCKFADASVRRFLQCINDEAVSYAGIDIKRLP